MKPPTDSMHALSTRVDSAPLPTVSAKTLADLDLGAEPLSIPLVWADGTRFRVSIYSRSQWLAIPESERPEGWAEKTGRGVAVVTGD